MKMPYQQGNKHVWSWRWARCLLGVLSLYVACVAAAVDVEGLRLSIEHLCTSFPEDYEQGSMYLERLDALEAAGDTVGLAALQREALLDNPLLQSFSDILLVKRGIGHLGLPQNWQSNSCLPRAGHDNEIALLSASWDAPRLSTLYRPSRGAFVGDLELHFDGDRLLFSMSDPRRPWGIYEMRLDQPTPQRLSLIDEPDVDNYEGCYLPDGNIIFASTAPFVGVPCVMGASHVSNLYRYDRDTGHIRRLTYEQDHNWCPVVLPNGRVLYQRWEYSDIPHFASRILFHMNPDGTEQMEYYGSNSYWPNALFYARPLPGSATRFVAIVGGHHGVPRMGELTLFDTALGRREADGALQRIPGRGVSVEPVLLDNLVDASWPRFLHPWPLSEHYFLVSAKPTPRSPWGLYVADVFDNLVLLKELDEYALFEPVPVAARPTPPIVPSKVDTERTDAKVFMTDVYEGPGLEGVPRGTVTALRIFTYHFAYHGMGGQINRIGLDGPWDIKRVLGTTPVEPDGSAFFRVPANTPVSVQPLDAEGKAIQLMRSWMTAMPGETLSCVGCHEPQNTTPPPVAPHAARRAPTEITPWRGPVRGFSFVREVQPVLDGHCVSCHNGASDAPAPDFRDLPPIHPDAGDAAYREGTTFTPAYLALRRYVRTPTIESDMHLPPPYEFHADTTHLVQHLQQHVCGEGLCDESWDRLITWIDLGAPAHGTWREIVGDDKVLHQRDRRRAMAALYAPGTDEDPEAFVAGTINIEAAAETTDQPKRQEHAPQASETDVALPLPEREIDLGDGVTLTLVLIPAGEFVMGDPAGPSNEWPAHVQRVDAPFWMGRFEVTNAQYARFDPEHDSRLEHGDFLQFSVEERGYPLNAPDQPVTRVRWRDAMAFCAWLSEKTGDEFSLPTEMQWEYACRAGTNTALWFGDVAADFTEKANLADYSLAHIDTFEPWGLPSGAVAPWRPAATHLNDGHRVSAPVGSYRPNPWGLYDMHGNVAEWTYSRCRPYPYQADSDDTEPDMLERRVVRGGSWYDTPARARAAARRSYHPWQPVFDVGFRVVAAVGASE